MWWPLVLYPISVSYRVVVFEITRWGDLMPLGWENIQSIWQSQQSLRGETWGWGGKSQGTPPSVWNTAQCLTLCLYFVLQVSFWTPDQEKAYPPSKMLFTKSSVGIIWGMQPRAVQVTISLGLWPLLSSPLCHDSCYIMSCLQGMLDYDHVCSRETPSVAAMVYPFRWVWGNFEKWYVLHSSILHSPFQWQPQTEILLGTEGGHDSRWDTLN